MAKFLNFNLLGQRYRPTDPLKFQKRMDNEGEAERDFERVKASEEEGTAEPRTYVRTYLFSLKHTLGARPNRQLNQDGGLLVDRSCRLRE